MPVLAGRGSNLAKHTYESKINLAEEVPDFTSFAKSGDKIANLATLSVGPWARLYLSPLTLTHDQSGLLLSKVFGCQKFHYCALSLPKIQAHTIMDWSMFENISSKRGVAASWLPADEYQMGIDADWI